MPSSRAARPFEPRSERRELVRLVRQIQTLTLEVRQLQLRQGGAPELHAKERTLEQLRSRLAAVARRAATNYLDAAA